MKCPMECGEMSEVLLAYCARRLEPETAAIVERHIASCAACRRVCDGQRAVWEALEAWEAIPVAPDFDRRLSGRIEWEAAASWWAKARLGKGLARRGLPLAAAACLLMAAVGIMEPWGKRGEESAATAMQADQVERTLEDLELLDAFSREVRAQAQPPSPL